MKIPRISRLLAAGLIATCLLSVGCNTDTSVIGGEYDTARSYPNITLSQPTLADALGFQEPSVTRTPNNLMHVTLPVRALSNQELHVEYKVNWFDAAGQPILPETSWVSLRLEPRQPTYVAVTSSSPDATNYNLQFRWARP
jgi:uncharacterized protein YcfL